METRVVHPSLKPVWVWYAIAGIAIVAGGWVYNSHDKLMDKPPWLMAIPALLLIVPIKKHISTRLFRMTIGADRLTLDRGLLSRYSRTIDLAKIQDVTVQQSVWQRIFGMGDVSLETAGEAGQIAIHGIDRAREVRDIILERSRSGRAITGEPARHIPQPGSGGSEPRA